MHKQWMIFIWLALGYVFLCAGCFLMLRIVLGYLSFNKDVQFLHYKQAYIHIAIWRTAFYIHVFSAFVALFAGFSQFSADFLKKCRPLHRRLGRLYVYDILLVNVPAGMILAIYANGYLPGKIAFILLDSLWFLFTLRAVLAARNRDFESHRNNMIRSYALTLAAISLRTWKIILTTQFHFDPLSIYMMDAWLGFLPNLFIAECIIRRHRLAAKISCFDKNEADRSSKTDNT